MTGNNRQGLIVQDRDQHLLYELGVMRVMDGEQAKLSAGFGSTTRVNARLLALTRAGLLRRFYIGNAAGGKKALYTLTREGERLGGGMLPGLRRRGNQVLVADFFVSHQLLLNDIYCLLKYREIPLPEVKFLRWVSLREPVTPGASLVPDGYVELAQLEQVLAAFVEVDLGTEPLSVWRKKVKEYVDYAVSRQNAEESRLAEFRVLVVTNSDTRLASLRRTTADETERVFWFTTFDSIKSEGFWSAIWWRPGGDQRLALIEAHP